MNITPETKLTDYLLDTADQDFDAVQADIVAWLSSTSSTEERVSGKTYAIRTFSDLSAIPDDARKDMIDDFVKGLEPFRDVIANAHDLAEALGVDVPSIGDSSVLSWTDDAQPERTYRFRV